MMAKTATMLEWRIPSDFVIRISSFFVIGLIRGRFPFPLLVSIAVNSWLNRTSLTPSYEGQIRSVWGKAFIQTREQRIAHQWDGTIHRTRLGKQH